MRSGLVAAAVLALALALASVAQAEARTSLSDVEDEVMCVQCGTPLNLSTAPRGRPRARIHKPRDRAG